MHPPLGWFSSRRSGIVANIRHSLPAAPDLDVSDRFVFYGRICSCGSARVSRRRNEPRNYRDHHWGLGHYRFGDSDPADDLARLHREAGSGATSTPARVQAGVRSQTSTRKPDFGLAVRSGVVTRRGRTHARRWDGIGWIMLKHRLSIDQLVSVDLVRTFPHNSTPFG